ncbi:LysR family transcriptional regulator [Arthrobacter mangrovi]|uniref:LysR family transcriptional regulator n=1 Tax=Arthrobacter mangrovi TaxID=2966350 RepID=A0ABQ5MRC5_9MICC|nr:LysR family transcriptional regulator [Arthrobacter mangrovi]GLB66529.1 LysR family transcriptional regulator [Arthrobacter mangrovi]
MDTKRLRTFLELSRSGSMREVADLLGTNTSTVSQQMAVLAREAGAVLLEPSGRGVRLTPAGRRLAAHAVTILTAVDAARADLQPGAEPAGTVRVAGFATAIRRSLMPIIQATAARHPSLQVTVHEHEPAEAIQMLLADEVDLALTYDYSLAALAADPRLDLTPLWSTPWGLGVPLDAAGHGRGRGSSPAVFAAYRERDWIGNSRNRADADVLRIIGSLAGFEPRIRHEADSLDLVEDLIVADMGIGLLPGDRKPGPGVAILSLNQPEVVLRAYAQTRKGRSTWPPLRYVLDRLIESSEG